MLHRSEGHLCTETAGEICCVPEIVARRGPNSLLVNAGSRACMPIAYRATSVLCCARPRFCWAALVIYQVRRGTWSVSSVRSSKERHVVVWVPVATDADPAINDISRWVCVARLLSVGSGYALCPLLADDAKIFGARHGLLVFLARAAFRSVFCFLFFCWLRQPR